MIYYRYNLTTVEHKLQFTFWIFRYLFTLIAFVLGIKAPGIRQRHGVDRQVLMNDEESTEQTPLRESHSTGSTWRNFFKKIATLLPYIWPKKSIALQIRVIFCFILLIGNVLLISKWFIGFICYFPLLFSIV